MESFKFTKKEKIYLCLALIVLLILFISSSMPYHEQKMQPGFINNRLGFLEKLLSPISIYYGGKWHNVFTDGGAGFVEFIIRKLAHFFTYFFLGIFLYLGLKRIFKIKWVGPIMIWFSAIAFASFDEYHQFLTGDRTPSVHDVMLDAAGALVGIVLIVLILKIRNQFVNKT